MRIAIFVDCHYNKNMADKPVNSASAFNAFAQKLKRFDASTTATPPTFKSPSKVYQAKIRENEDAYKKSIIGAYKKFLSPYETFGKNSGQAAEIDSDRESLLAAYNLYKSVQELNAKSGNNSTFIKSVVIETPLTGKDRYTIGGEFIYLQCWLKFENRINDFVPEIVPVNDTWILRFVPEERFRFSGKEKETAETILQCFYPGAK